MSPTRRLNGLVACHRLASGGVWVWEPTPRRPKRKKIMDEFDKVILKQNTLAQELSVLVAQVPTLEIVTRKGEILEEMASYLLWETMLFL